MPLKKLSVKGVAALQPFICKLARYPAWSRRRCGQPLTWRENCAIGPAELLMEETPLVVYCHTCRAERTLTTPQQLLCPACGQPTPQVVRGRELEVVALEIEE